MTESLIIGSGPAAAGAALALSQDPSQRITVIDIGHRLEANHRQAVVRLASAGPSAWNKDDLDLIRLQPASASVRGLPEKRAYGSDFPFRDVGQLQGVSGNGEVNQSVVSGAYGGLSNVWGSQIMVFTDATFQTWPVSATEMRPHYERILNEIPYAGEEDALSQHFPLVGPARPLPPLAPRTNDVLAAAAAHHDRLAHSRVLVGRARLALQSDSCVRCGLCMTGCPYSLIYSASHTFDRLRTAGRIEYHDRLMATELGQEDERPFVRARHMDGSDQLHTFSADRIFVACGALGTTRLVLGSLRLFDQDVHLGESVQFALPMMSRRPTPDPRGNAEFTLNQFNMVIATDDDWLDVSQIHFYPYNPAVIDAMPGILDSKIGTPIADQVLRRMTIGLGYLPSWASPTLRVRATAPSDASVLPGLVLSGDILRPTQSPMFRNVLRRILRVAPSLDLWPVLPMMFFAAPGKSYHFGGSFPHSDAPADGPLTTDRLGRLSQWSNIHLIDASVFPNVPATTFTLTIMANAHRIAAETEALPS
jgi:ferredoxin